MIKVINKNGIIKITGHANFDNVGKDIVCASVSSIVLTTVNIIFNIDNESISYVDDGKTMIIEKTNDNNTVDIILNTMIELLKDLENQYKNNIKIESEE